MADITACQGHGCLLRQNCYRYNCGLSFRQSFFARVPWTMYEGQQICAEQWPMREEKNKNDKTGIRLRPDSL